jgi:dipeptide/tripeptide permease
MKVRLFCFLLFLISGIGLVKAQVANITGNVVSAEDKEPIVGVSLIVKGTTIGTVTDIDGKFTLKVPQDAKILKVSFVGMKTVELPITSVMHISL